MASKARAQASLLNENGRIPADKFAVGAIPTVLTVAKRTGPVDVSVTNATITVEARTGNISVGVS